MSEYLRSLERTYRSFDIGRIRKIHLAELLGDDCAHNLFLPAAHVRPGSTPLHDLAVLAALVSEKKPQCVFEIGTFEGLTSVVFAKNGNERCHVYTLDLPHQEATLPRTARSYRAHSIAGPYDSGKLIDTFRCGQQVTRLLGDSAVFDFTPFYDKVDLFFVDGAHTEDYVALDSLHALRCVAPGGWVVWHDCFLPQVMSVLQQISRYLLVYQIEGANLALTLQKPGPDFPLEMLRRRIQ